MTPLISIIIPNYNRENLIGETLDSIVAQTYTNWECIVVDDGSTDSSKKVIQTYVDKDPRFQLHDRPENKQKGANACRNYGFELSKGEYVNWFDSDDLMLPEKLEIQIGGLINSNYDYTICQTKVVDIEKDKDMGQRSPNLKSENTFEDYILFKVFWLTGAPLWKSSFIKENNLLFDEELQQSQDYDFHMRVLVISENYLPIEKSLVVFRFHDDNMSNSIIDSLDKIYSNLKVKNNILDKYNSKLSNNAQRKVFSHILIIYKNALIKKKTKYSLIIMKSLLLNINKMNHNFFEKVLLVLKIITAFFSYHLFQKGDRLLRI